MKRDTLGVGCRPNHPKPEVDDDCGTPKPTKTMLDEFAMAAMAALISITKPAGSNMTREEIFEELAKQAYFQASAMMKERSRRDEMGNVKVVE